jgi:transcriptional regulator with XRE-family HTH domain
MMTQEELALKSGVGTRTVRDIESGKVRPQPRTLRLLIEALDLDEADLAIMAGAPEEPAVRDLAPMTLPSGTTAFTGRSASLAMLDEAADTASSPLVVLSGTGGVGKTMLALHWGHRAADRFPGGRFYLDLHGFAPGAIAMEPPEAVRHLLGAMGVGPQRLPTEADAQLALYRTLIGSERRLLILDNVRDAEQVRPLLPDGAQVHTVVISRRRLVGLAASHGAATIEVGTFDTAEAAALLERQLGAARLAAEPEAAERVLASCAGLPLALAIAGARAATRPSPWAPSPTSWPHRGSTRSRSMSRRWTSGRCSPGPTARSNPTRPGCSGCWPSSPAPTSTRLRPCGSTAAPSRTPDGHFDLLRTLTWSSTAAPAATASTT